MPMVDGERHSVCAAMAPPAPPEVEDSRGCGAAMPPWRCGELMPVGLVALCDRCVDAKGEL